MKSNRYQFSFQSIKDSRDQIREVTEGRLRTAVLDMVYELFDQEVQSLCGPRYSRDSEAIRNGSDPGSVILQGQRVSVRKPRVKRGGKDLKLETYSALRQYDMLCEKVREHMIRGVSTRDLKAHQFASLMIDGVGFGDRTVIVAMGIEATGEKMIFCHRWLQSIEESD